MKLTGELNVLLILVFSLTSVNLALLDNRISGTECDSYYGTRGRCMNVKQCTTLKLNGKNNTERKHVLLNSVCDFQNNILYVCCPETTYKKMIIHRNSNYPLPIKMVEDGDAHLNDNFINKFIANSSQFLSKPPSCGQSFDEMTRQSITLGEIKKGQYPWIGSIGEITDEEEIEISQVTLITKRHVLSTAHTIYTALENYIKVNYVWFQIYTDDHTVEEMHILPVLDILVHPDFNRSYYTNDIALIKLENEVNDPSLRPICLPTIPALSNVIYDGLKAILYTSVDSTNADNNEILSTTQGSHYVEILSKQKCREQYGNKWNSIIEKSTICTKKVYQNDFCSYTGAPLMLPYVNPDNNGVGYYLLGFRTTGPDDCTTNSSLPQLHLRVPDYLNWIENYILY